MKGFLFKKSLTSWQVARARAAIGAGRLIQAGLRVLGRGGTALPGKIALLGEPHLLSWLCAGRQVFLVTGTNGKTTTVSILCSLLKASGYRTITNPSGANLDTGLTATLLEHLPELFKADGQSPLALVFEIDEAFFGKLAASLNPSVSIVTNFFRDQLDRFGELQHTRDLIARGLAASGSKAVLCADDSLCASLGLDLKAPVYYFGLEAEAMHEQLGDAIHEASFCTLCGSRYQYDGMSYGHLGRFSCPGCGFHRPEPGLAFLPLSQSTSGQILRITWHGSQDGRQAQPLEEEANLPVPGLHNAYNAAGAILAFLAAGLPFHSALAALPLTRAAFGRMERFTVGQKDVCLILVKNPVGMDRALEFVANAPDAGGTVLFLNSNDPDGRDVSWIWDVHFEAHLPPGRLGVSGERCHDMALRLYYAGKKPDELVTSPDHAALFDLFLVDCLPGRCLYVLPNYTAMLALRADLVRRYQLREFWR